MGRYTVLSIHRRHSCTKNTRPIPGLVPVGVGESVALPLLAGMLPLPRASMCMAVPLPWTLLPWLFVTTQYGSSTEAVVQLLNGHARVRVLAVSPVSTAMRYSV